MLEPENRPDDTEQGEIIRIAGRIGYELLNNVGANWEGESIPVS